MQYSIIAESNLYALVSCNMSNENVLLRYADNHICILSDEDTNLMAEIIDYENAFDTVASSFVFIDPLLEKSCESND